ncbi:DUF6228 family protein [Nocardia sp. NPDC004415]
MDEDAWTSMGDPGFGTWVRLGNRVDPWDDGSVQVCVEVGGPGLRAALHRVTLAVMGECDLVPFFDGLCADFAGWDGVREWSSVDRDLRIEAVFGSGGHIGLTWTVRPWRHADGNWSASTTVVVEVGEQMVRWVGELAVSLRGGLS